MTKNQPTEERDSWGMTPDELTIFTQECALELLRGRCQNCKSAIGTKRCVSCKKVNYCSLECQEMDWTYHKEFCRLVAPKTSSRSTAIKSTEQKNATISEAKGRATPENKTQSNAAEKLERKVIKTTTFKCCAECEKKATPESKHKLCSGCNIVRYCNSVCQELHRSVHKRNCRRYANYPTAVQQLILRQTLKAKRCQDKGDNKGVMLAAKQLFYAYMSLGNATIAESWCYTYKEAAEWRDSLNDVALASLLMGDICVFRGDTAEALEKYESSSLPIRALIRSANLKRSLGESVSAQLLLQKAVARARDQHLQMTAYYCLSLALREQGKEASANAALASAQHIADQPDGWQEPTIQVLRLILRGIVCSLTADQQDEATQCYLRAQRLAVDASIYNLEVFCLYQLADLAYRQDRHADALQYLLECFSVVEESGMQRERCELYRQRSIVYTAMGNKKEAYRNLNRSRNAALAIGDMQQLAATHLTMAEYHLSEAGEEEKVIFFYTAYLGSAFCSKSKKAGVYSQLAEAHARIGQTEQAIESSRKGLRRASLYPTTKTPDVIGFRLILLVMVKDCQQVQN